MKKYTIPIIQKNIYLFIIQPKINKNKKELKEVQSSFLILFVQNTQQSNCGLSKYMNFIIWSDCVNFII